eukprot:1225419-Prorocentrum_lima.AAC.1
MVSPDLVVEGHRAGGLRGHVQRCQAGPRAGDGSAKGLCRGGQRHRDTNGAHHGGAEFGPSTT